MRRAILFTLAMVPALARAVDEPHVKACDPAISCTSCHTLHNAPGGSLTSVAGNFNLCSSCHNQPGVGAKQGFPWYSEDQAIPGVGGHSHRWDAPLTNLGAQPPVDAAMSTVVTTAGDGNLQCSVCHDQHKSNPQFGGAQFVSVAVGSDLPPATGSGTGSMRVLQPSASAIAKGYLVEIVAGGAAGTATYRLSNDSGRTWFGWSGTAWVSYTTSNARVTGAGQALNDATNVSVSFSGSGFATGDRWTFYVGYPMLRASAIASAMCEDCHRGMVHDTIRTAGDDPAFPPNVGSNTFSHPVGVTLNASGAGYDRAAPLAADGHPQGTSGTAAPTDLVLAATDATVRCLTCHAVHNTVSNSLAAQP